MPSELPAREELLDYLLSFDMFEKMGRRAEGVEYVTFHLERFIKTLRQLPRLPGRVRVLELGASPYFMTFLIKKYFGYEITPANFFLDYGEETSDYIEKAITISSKKYGEEHTFQFRQFNLEFDPFPHQDGEFDLVLCCEILEHLALDPVHMIREAHRVLKPGGHLVLTTPNAKRLEQLWLMLRGWNVHAAYSGDGVYGRHNREYTRWEVNELLRLNNFEPRVQVRDAYHHGLSYRLLAKLLPSRRDNLFASGRKHGATVEVRPAWLYDQPEARVFVQQDRIVMGERDSLQLGAGWHPFEHWPPGVRWTGAEATAFLAPRDRRRALRLKLHGGPRGSHARLFLNGRAAGSIALAAAEARELELALPEDVARELRAGHAHVLEVRLVVDDAVLVAHAGAGSPGTRTIGVAVERMELS